MHTHLVFETNELFFPLGEFVYLKISSSRLNMVAISFLFEIQTENITAKWFSQDMFADLDTIATDSDDDDDSIKPSTPNRASSDNYLVPKAPNKNAIPIRDKQMERGAGGKASSKLLETEVSSRDHRTNPAMLS